MERKEREDRRKNIVIRGIKSERGEIERKREREKIIREIGVEVEIEEVMGIGAGREGEIGMTVVRIKKLEQKREIMKNRRKVAEKGVRIEENLTWKERKMRWRIKTI